MKKRLESEAFAEGMMAGAGGVSLMLLAVWLVNFLARMPW